MSNYQDHLTEPPISVGDYLPIPISDEELKKIIKARADMCMAILNGDEIEHENCYEHCSKRLEEEENETNKM